MTIKVNGVTLYYEKTGEGAPLLLLHGNGEDHTIFDRAIPLLAARFTVYAIDTRGHGKSSPVAHYDYRDMARDVIAFIGALGLEKPVLYGFSDGGIVALLVEIAAPHTTKQLIVSGANTVPRGLDGNFLRNAAREWRKTRAPLLELLLTQPHIRRRALAAIDVPVHVLAGEHDLIRTRHTRRLAAAIPRASLQIEAGETHESYIVHSEKIAHILLGIIK